MTYVYVEIWYIQTDLNFGLTPIWIRRRRPQAVGAAAARCKSRSFRRADAEGVDREPRARSTCSDADYQILSIRLSSDNK